MVPRLHIRQEPGRQRRAGTDSWLASQDRARTAGLVHGPSRAFKSDLAGRFALDRAAGVRCAPKEGDLDVTCAKCGSRRWIGLVYCTQCGQLAEETSDSLVPPTKLVPVYLGPVDLRSGRSRRLFPVCGDLIIDRRDGPAEVWQYRGQGCTMDVFLYKKGESLDVRHVDLRGPAPSEAERRHCLAELIRAQLTHGASS